MTRDGQQNSGASAPRVYKAGDVHKRRSGRKSRETQGQRTPAETRDRRRVPTGDFETDVSNAGAIDEIVAEEGAVEERAAQTGRLHAGLAGAVGLAPDVSPEDGSDDSNDSNDLGALSADDAADDAPEDEVAAGEGDDSEFDVDAEAVPEDDFDEAAGDLTSEGARTQHRVRRPKGKAIAKAIVAIVVLAVVACASFLAWNRWGRFDDHADMQGEWYVEGTATPVVIDEEYIHLDQNIAYSYTINDRDKTIVYTFADWEGKGRYRFSDDRTQLVITDGEFSGADNTVDDLTRPFSEIVKPSEEGVIAFNRQADPKALEAKQAEERAAAAKAQKEALEGGEEGEEGEDAAGVNTDVGDAGEGTGEAEGADTGYAGEGTVTGSAGRAEGANEAAGLADDALGEQAQGAQDTQEELANPENVADYAE